MKIKISEIRINYTRYIEGMGKGLVLFKVKAEKKAIGQNYHYFYEDKKKPPLDIAVNPRNNMIEYISFFVQDEKIKLNKPNIEIELVNRNIEFCDFSFDKDYLEERLIKSFALNFDNNNLYLLDEECSVDLIGYEINTENYILFDKDNVFQGLLLSNFCDDEINEMKQSLVL